MIETPSENSQTVEDRVSNFKFSFSQKLDLKPFQFLLLNQYFLNNISSQNQVDFMLLDMELHYKLSKNKPSFFLKAKNILNETQYYALQNSIQQQSFYAIPLVKRNFLVGMRLEF
jgi:hypothetical protein